MQEIRGTTRKTGPLYLVPKTREEAGGCYRSGGLTSTNSQVTVVRLVLYSVLLIIKVGSLLARRKL